MVRASLALLVAIAITGAWMTWPAGTLSHVTTTNTVMFDREIVSILDAHCVSCHAADRLAAPLVTYEETWLSRGPVLEEVLARHMPPWAAVPGYGKFANDNTLTTRETQFLTSWVEGLGPRNDGSVFLNVLDAGEVPTVVQADADRSGWVLGEPDLVVGLPETVVAPAQGERIERVAFDLGLAGAMSIRGLEYRPGAANVVRAATFRIESTGQWLGSWTPWHGYVELPDGAAYRLPAGTRIGAEIYYGTTAETVVDQGSLGFFQAGSTESSPVTDLVLETTGTVPTGTEAVRFQTEAVVEADTRIVALLPQFEPGIESLEVSVRRPDGGTEILLFARDIPVEWPTPYVFADAVLVSSGSRIRATAYYSNPSGSAQPGGFRLTLSRY